MSSTMYGLARIGRDAELRRTTQGEAVCGLSLAFTYGRRDTSGRQPVNWVEGSLWGKRAESLAEYLVKGQSVMVTLNDVHMEVFKNRDGGDAAKIVGRVADIEFSGPKPEARQAPPTPPARPAAAAKPSSGFDDMSDDIPW